MAVSSLIHYGIDVTLAAMLLAAIRRDTGMVFAYENYDIGSYLHTFLRYGEWCYDRAVKYVKRSRSFRKTLPTDQLTQDSRIEELERN